MLFGRHFSSFKLCCVRNFSEDYDTLKKTARHFCVALLIGNIHLIVSDIFNQSEKSDLSDSAHFSHPLKLSFHLFSKNNFWWFLQWREKSELFRKTFFRWSCLSSFYTRISCCHERTLKSRFMWSQKRRVQFVFRCNSRFRRDRQIVTSYFIIVNVAFIFQQQTKPSRKLLLKFSCTKYN